MKIKKFIAPSMTEAMNLVREELGDEAVIISSETIEGKHCLTAAIEEAENIGFDHEDQLEITPGRHIFDDTHLRDCLEYHGVVDTVAERILAYVRNYSLEYGIKDEPRLLTSCFETMFTFGSLWENCPVKMFMGVPGSGKSTAIAKVATQARFQKKQTCIISTDNVRAGANHQLEAFARILETDFYFCGNERSLYEAVKKARQNYELILVDTPGINPFIDEETERLRDISEAVKSDIILTMDIGKNTCEAVEIAEIFSRFGVKYILPTRLDLTRRIGALISVAACCRLSYCAASVNASIAQGLAEINARSLAKLILA